MRKHEAKLTLVMAFVSLFSRAQYAGLSRLENPTY